MNKDTVFVTVTLGVRGYFSVIVQYDHEGEYWYPDDSSAFAFTRKVDAENEGRARAKDLDLPYYTQEEYGALYASE